MFYAAKHKPIHLQLRNVGQTLRRRGYVLWRTTPTRLWQDQLEMKCQHAVMRAKLGLRLKEVSWEVGKCYVISPALVPASAWNKALQDP